MSRVVVVAAAAALLMVGLCGCARRIRTVAPPPEQVMPAADEGDSWRFTEGAAGSLPEGFRSVEGHWGIAAEAEARGLLQQAKNPNRVFNLVLIDGKDYTDVQISVGVHALAGEVDQGGGPIWRAQDGRNYYIARWNPLEDNYRVYKVVDGVRIQLASAETKPGSSSRLLVIRMTGSTIECSLDGEALLLVEDTTFPGAGKIGLWTKADARTLFTDLTATRP